MTVPEMLRDVVQVHQKEKSQFPSDVATLAPARNYVAEKLIKANILKNIQEDLNLFDSYKHEDEVKLREEMRNTALLLHKSTLIVPVISSLAFLKYKKLSILELNSYINNVTPLLIIYGLSLFGVSLARTSKALRLQGKSLKDYQIYNAKATLHSVGIKVANSLKYPDNELH